MNMQNLTANIPQELRNLKSWVAYILKPNGQRTDKIPINVLSGGPAKSNDSKTWTDFQTALDLAVKCNYFGVGFMFTPPYVGVDLDHCIKDGATAPYALEILKSFNSYAEVSPSGEGIHIICKGEIARACKISKLGLEVYTKGRFFTVTGNRLTEYSGEVNECTTALKILFSQYAPKSLSGKILELISKSQDAEKFNRLYSGQWQNDYPSQSEADLALASKLAFWTGKDSNLMDELFRKSGLMRLKWDERHFADGSTYGQSVITKAIENCSEVYKSGQALPKQESPRPTITHGESLTRDCEEHIQDFFKDQQGNPCIVLPFNGHHEVCLASGMRFRNWMARRYRSKYGFPPGSDTLIQARIQIEAKCEEARTVELFNRVGLYEGAIYYDLSSSDWCGVRIDKAGWEIVKLPVIFRRYQHQKEQVRPVKGTDAREFLRFCNIAQEDECLFMASVASFFIPNIPHVIISQNGEQGSGKSNNSRKIKSLIDPSKVMLLSNPKDLEQAQMTAEKHWLTCFDNLARIKEWFSDFLCRAVTGEGDMKRSLYTDDEEFIRSYRRCFVLNGIGVPLWRTDLLDRAIVFDVPVLNQTLPESQIEVDWQKALPGILGGFFTAVSEALLKVEEVSGHENYRMCDFTRWAIALAEALGYSKEQFLQQYQHSIETKWKDTAEENALVVKIQTLLDSCSGFWEGSVTSLLESLRPEEGFDKTIPSNPRAFASELMRIAQVLRNVGIDVIRQERRQAGTGRKVFTLRKIEPEASDEQY